MKIARSLSRILLSLVLVGLMVQHSAPLLAQNEQVSELQTMKKRFNKIAKCALTKEGCTEQEALQLRALFGSIVLLILALAGISLGLYLRQSKKLVPSIQIPGEAPTLYRGYAPQAYEQYESYRESLIHKAREVQEKATKWWQRK